MVRLQLKSEDFNKIETDKDIVIKQVNPEEAISLYNKVNIYPHWESRSISNYYSLITPHSVTLNDEVIGYFDMFVNHISSVALKPQYLNKGLGKIFVNRIFEHGLKDFEFIRLETTNKDNPNALKVYKALGCKEINDN